MDQSRLEGADLHYEAAGAGELVVFIHGALIADSFRPLLVEPALIGRHRLIAYHRRDYGRSAHPGVPVSLARQALDCKMLTHSLGVEKAHIVGHSLGGCIAIQFTLDNPDSVASLALLEPALMVGSTGPAYREALLRGRQRFRDGPAASIVDEFLKARFGPDYLAPLETKVPGAFEQAVNDAATSFELELPGWLEWRFGEAEAKRITHPVLAVLGSKSNALWSRFGETHRLLQEWLPQTEAFILPDAAHGLQMQNPSGMAQALADFFSRHSMSVR